MPLVLRRAAWLAEMVIKSVGEHIGKRIFRLLKGLVLLMSIVLADWSLVLKIEL